MGQSGWDAKDVVQVIVAIGALLGAFLALAQWWSRSREVARNAMLAKRRALISLRVILATLDDVCPRIQESVATLGEDEAMDHSQCIFFVVQTERIADELREYLDNASETAVTTDLIKSLHLIRKAARAMRGGVDTKQTFPHWGMVNTGYKEAYSAVGREVDLRNRESVPLYRRCLHSFAHWARRFAQKLSRYFKSRQSRALQSSNGPATS